MRRRNREFVSTAETYECQGFRPKADLLQGNGGTSQVMVMFSDDDVDQSESVMMTKNSEKEEEERSH